MAKQKNIGRKKDRIRLKMLVRDINLKTSLLPSKHEGIVLISGNKPQLAFAHVGSRLSEYCETYVEL